MTVSLMAGAIQNLPQTAQQIPEELEHPSFSKSILNVIAGAVLLLWSVFSFMSTTVTVLIMY